MRYLRYFFIFGLAFLIFLGVFLAEKSHWKLFSSVQNPLEQAVSPTGQWKILEEDQSRSLLTQEGEIFVPQVGTILDFDTRELVQGGGLWSTNFVDFSKVSSQPQKPLSPGWMQIGDILILSEGGSVFLEKSGNNLAIKAYDHAIDIFFPGEQDAFILPLLSQVVLDVSDPQPEIQSFSTLEEPHQEALRTLRDHRQALTHFVRRVPRTWVRFRISTLWGKFLDLIQRGQQQAMGGIAPSKEQRLAFKHAIAPYVEAYDLSARGKTILARPYLQTFEASLEGLEWYGLRGTEVYQEQWEPYQTALKSLLRNTLKADQNRYLGNFWADQWGSKTLENTIREIEMLVIEGSLTKARMELEKVLVQMPKENFKAEDLSRLIRFRVILTHLMQQHKELQTSSIFAGYQSLLSQELAFRPELELKSEITDDILFWYHYFLGEELEAPTLEILLALYDSFVMEDSVSGSDRELVAFVDSVKSTNLTPERMALIKQSQAEQAAFQEQIKELEAQGEAREEERLLPQIASGRVSNVRALKSWLAEQAVEVPAKGFHTVPSRGVTEFSGGSYEGREVSGVFDYPSQSFLIFEIGDHAHEQFHMRFLKGVLAQSMKEVKIDLSLPDTDVQGRLVQEGDSPEFIQQREIIKKALDLQGFEVSRSNIRAMRSDLSRFQLLEVEESQSGAMLSFMYDRTAQQYYNIRITQGGENISLGNQKIPAADLGKVIEEKLKELTVEN